MTTLQPSSHTSSSSFSSLSLNKVFATIVMLGILVFFITCKENFELLHDNFTNNNNGSSRFKIKYDGNRHHDDWTISSKSSSSSTSEFYLSSHDLSYNDMITKLIGINHDNDSDVNSDRRVVILAGPHKTGSTSIQNNFYQWTTNSSQYLLKSWSWPVPTLITHYESQDPNNWNWNPSKGFYALVETLRNPTNHTITNRILFQNISKETILQTYQHEFYMSWLLGYNIVIGSEAFDNVIKDDADDGEQIINGLINLMPWNYNTSVIPTSRKGSSSNEIKYHTSQKNNERITVVITYRIPRIKHLISIWRETKKENQSFQKWMRETKNNLGAIDSLGLVERFLNKGLKVVIADIAGITSSGYDISNIIACEILNSTCTKEKQLKGSNPPLVMNTKQNFNGNIDVTDEQLNLMDGVMRQYDCKYLTLIKKYKKSNQLQLLYPTELNNVLQSCEKNNNNEVDSKISFNRVSMKKKLVCIVEGKNNCNL